MAPLEKVNRLIRNQVGKQRQSTTNATELVAIAVEAALSKKAENILVMNLRDVTGMADYFVVCDAGSDIQVKAIANSVKDLLREQAGEKPWHSEGLDSLQWVLLDYVDVVVHIMTPDKREFYGLERLWGDAKTVDIPDESNLKDVKALVTSLA